MSRFTKTLSSGAAAAALVGIAAVGVAPSASAASVRVSSPKATTAVSWSYGTKAPAAPVKRVVYASVKNGSSWAYAWAWTTNPRCTIMAGATLNPRPTAVWVACAPAR
ncbi:hypothetical protein [Falsarthrobacter nasiphocae]|uniref:Uncharacterized protein n=1 Tax=Falsarthrobacter nasiphocae TaxID=189863 RepID=A0AAE3YHD4_9MICC|nr:hypothetical protein [Falsarthrobacter nasiphocae]MDR6892317.1 hypothetical protein [Falsarthrobacter nasiphocae]